jgi:hypothetical protein
MMGEVGEHLGGEGALFFADSEGALQMGAFCKALDSAVEKGDPVLVAGTAFSFVRWGNWAKEKGWNVLLPPGSRIMETGGYKGRIRVVARTELYSALHGSLGVPADHIVNEYGMTELLSQFYEPVLKGEAGAGGEGGEGSASLKELAVRYHRGPPWVRTLVLDPLTLVPLPEGEVGILAHFDLANLGSVAAVLTEDLGRPVPGGFRLMGRSQGAEPRGCSLAMEEFMASISEGS